MKDRTLIYGWGRHLLLAVAVLYGCSQLVSVVAGRKQTDFRVYYDAAKASQAGLDPYNFESRQEVSGSRPQRLPFVYPPHCLVLLKPFAALEYPTAYYLFLAAKAGALLALVAIWLRIVPAARCEWWALGVTVMLGHRSAVLRDLRSGNVSLFEELLIWGGILLIMRNRSLLGGATILLSSFFKLITAALIPLVVVMQRSWRSFRIAISLSIFGIATYAWLYLRAPDGWSSFCAIAGSLDERGNRCPSSLALLRDLGDLIGWNDVCTYMIYGAFCCFILSVLLWSFIATRRSPDTYAMLHLTILVYVLLAPRIKDYSLIIALLPTLHVLSTMVKRRWQAIAGCVLLWVPIIDYQSLLLSAGTFAIIVNWIWSQRRLTDPPLLGHHLDPFHGTD